MAWIELHQAIWTHRKTLALASRLGVPPTYAAAHLMHFWCWCLDNAPDGDLSSVPPLAIAVGAGWTGSGEELLEALVGAGWVDREGAELRLHDWMDYAGALVLRREAARDRAREWRASFTRGRTDVPSVCVPNAQRAGDVLPTGPNPTGPDLTGPDPTEPGSPLTPRSGGGKRAPARGPQGVRSRGMHLEDAAPPPLVAQARVKQARVEALRAQLARTVEDDDRREILRRHLAQAEGELAVLAMLARAADDDSAIRGGPSPPS
ncbi:MAG: hypothetical protein QOF51_2371 [Chloroflexota bacterium]|nr:hypothetical protein [Chloroflexota bacterium]